MTAPRKDSQNSKLLRGLGEQRAVVGQKIAAKMTRFGQKITGKITVKAKSRKKITLWGLKGYSLKYLRSVVVTRARKVLTPVDLPDLLATDEFIPQAVLATSIDELSARFRLKPFKGHDDFDEYEGIAFQIDKVPFAIMHYQGHPPKTSTIYLPQRVHDVKTISLIIRGIVNLLKLPPVAITWQRSDGPDF
jgi:hypothetical protein